MEATGAVPAAQLRAGHHGVLLRPARRGRTAVQPGAGAGPEDPDSQPLAARSPAAWRTRLHALGDGREGAGLGRQALGTGGLDPAAASRTRTLIAIGASQLAGPRTALAELRHLDADPARVAPVDVDGLTFRGVFRLLAGDLDQAVSDLAASLRLARRGATAILGLRAHCFLALAQYLAGAWDDAALTAEQGFSAAASQARRDELPLLHLARGCVLAGRGRPGRPNGTHALAEQAAASLDYGQERLYAAMARALVCQASEDYLGMADALGPWQDEAALDGRSRVAAVLWRPLLAEGLIGSGQIEQAAAVLAQLRGGKRPGRLPAARRGLAGRVAGRAARRPGGSPGIYARAEERAGTQSPVYTARLLLAHGQLLRRTGNRKDAVERLRQAHELYQALAPRRSSPGPRRSWRPAACPARPAAKQSVAGADQPGDRSGPPGREGAVQPGDRGRAVHQPQGRGIPPG